MFEGFDSTDTDIKPTRRLVRPQTAKRVSRAPLAKDSTLVRGPPQENELYPGRHLFSKTTTGSSLMASLMKIVKKEKEPAGKTGRLHSEKLKNDFAWPSEKADQKPNLTSSQCHSHNPIGKRSVRFIALKQYPLPDYERTGESGLISGTKRCSYLRHRDSTPSGERAVLKGVTKRRCRRRKWTTEFDEIEFRENRLLFARSHFHPIFYFLDFNQLSYALNQAWSDYDVCDASDFFTLMTFLSVLREDTLEFLPSVSNIHDFREYKTYVPPGIVVALQELTLEALKIKVPIKKMPSAGIDETSLQQIAQYAPQEIKQEVLQQIPQEVKNEVLQQVPPFMPPFMPQLVTPFVPPLVPQLKDEVFTQLPQQIQQLMQQQLQQQTQPVKEEVPLHLQQAQQQIQQQIQQQVQLTNEEIPQQMQQVQQLMQQLVPQQLVPQQAPPLVFQQTGPLILPLPYFSPFQSL